MKSLILWIGVVGLLGLSALMLKEIDDQKKQEWNLTREVYLPQTKWLDYTHFGFQNFLASYYWVQGILYFSNSYFERKPYPHLSKFFEITTHLNPQFEYAYYFGGLLLCEQKSTLAEGLKLLDKGIKNFPNKYQFRVFAAMCQLDLDSNQLKSAKYLLPLVHTPDVPMYLKQLAYTLLHSQKNTSARIDIQLTQYFQSSSEIEKEILLGKIYDLVSLNVSKEELKTYLNNIETNPQLYREFRENFFKSPQ